MIISRENIDDIQRYYQDTYVKLKEYGDKLFYIYSVGPQGVLFKDETGEEGILYIDTPYDLDYVLPHRAVFQHKMYAVSLSRHPARQYKRGLSGDNCRIFALTNDGWGPYSLTWEYLNSFTTKMPYVPLLDAMKGKYISAALSNRFSWRKADQSLWCDNIHIGYINHNVIDCSPVIRPELMEVLATTGNENYFSFKEKAK